MARILDDFGYRIKLPDEEYMAINLVDNGINPYKTMKKRSLHHKVIQEYKRRLIINISAFAKKSSIFAGLLASIPITSFLAFIWIYWETKDTQKIIDLSYTVMLMVIPSFAFFIILPLLLKLQNSFTVSIIISTISTAIIYWLFFELLNKFGIST